MNTDTPSSPQATTVAPHILLVNHFKALKLPTFAREYEKIGSDRAREGVDSPRYLLRLCELERIDRERRNMERRIRQAKFSVTKILDTFDFLAMPTLNTFLVLELARSEWIDKRENIIALGPSGVGKTHTALALGLAACQKGYSVAFTSAASLVHELMEACDERRLRALHRQLTNVKLLMVGELGYVPFTAVGGNCCSKCLAVAMNKARHWLLRICLSMNGPACLVWSGSPVPCSTASPIMSISWK